MESDTMNRVTCSEQQDLIKNYDAVIGPFNIDDIKQYIINSVQTERKESNDS